mgnify:CR=1 FL=1
MVYRIKGTGFWLDEVADAFLSYLEERGASGDAVLTLASGMTPSCPIHFGIFREILVTSFVAQELEKRGRRVRLVYYWDDYDHFCKIPWYTNREAVAPYLGKALRDVPDFEGGCASYGERYMRQFEKELAKLGVEPEYNYQSALYAAGAYASYLRLALENRFEVFDCLNEHRLPYNAETIAERERFYPVEVYCSQCKRDRVTVKSWDPASDTLVCVCRDCGFEGAYAVGDSFTGKLVWKANWATRWHDDSVHFESSGENQLTETGSYAGASRIVERVYGSQAPFSLLYRFVGIPGVAKVSRALGKDGLASRLTGLLEPAMVRWAFARYSPDKPFSLDLGDNISRLYHEWDVLLAKVAGGRAEAAEKRLFDIAATGARYCPIPIPYRTVLTAVCLAKQDLRKAAALLNRIGQFHGSDEELFNLALPRLECAAFAVRERGDGLCGVSLRDAPDPVYIANLPEAVARSVEALAEGISECETEEEISALLASAAGIGSDAEFRKSLYGAVYTLLTGKPNGPRLSTLLSLAGPSTVAYLLKGETVYAK